MVALAQDNWYPFRGKQQKTNQLTITTSEDQNSLKQSLSGLWNELIINFFKVGAAEFATWYWLVHFGTPPQGIASLRSGTFSVLHWKQHASTPCQWVSLRKHRGQAQTRFSIIIHYSHFYSHFSLIFSLLMSYRKIILIVPKCTNQNEEAIFCRCKFQEVDKKLISEARQRLF